KKKPPTFQHLPLNRAKKLKKEWVTVQKIKSQWKAQKRKEGLVPSRPVDAELSDHPDKAESDEKTSSQKDASEESSDDENVEQEDSPTLRDLQRQAYSKSSLHSFKSGHSNRSNGGRGRGSDRGRGFHTRGRGRGQPDMRLRMNVMLEKIKRDFT
ncbi:hypothetical protein K474DRAFT_1566880, partial [Panus rudis PR-1116 ss-1]